MNFKRWESNVNLDFCGTLREMGNHTQSAITCSKVTRQTEQGVKYVQN